MIGLGGRETLLRLRQGYHVTMEAGEDSLDVMAVPRCDTCRHWRPAIRVPPGGVRGTCGKFDIVAVEDFGCVKWEPKK